MKLIVEQGSVRSADPETVVGREVSLERPLVSIGRGGDNDLVLPEQGVSRHHACFEHGPQGWLLTDLGSTNGTYVNEERLPGHEARLLRPGDRLRIGSTVLSVRQEEEPAPGGKPGGHRAAQKAGRPAPALMIAGAVGLLVVLAGLVMLLVLVLKPAEGPPTPTAVDPMQHMLTAAPMPTGFEQMVTAVAPILPSGLPLPFFGGTPTPTPEAAVPGRELAGWAHNSPAGSYAPSMPHPGGDWGANPQDIACAISEATFPGSLWRGFVVTACPVAAGCRALAVQKRLKSPLQTRNMPFSDNLLASRLFGSGRPKTERW